MKIAVGLYSEETVIVVECAKKNFLYNCRRRDFKVTKIWLKFIHICYKEGCFVWSKITIINTPYKDAHHQKTKRKAAKPAEWLNL